MKTNDTTPVAPDTMSALYELTLLYEAYISRSLSIKAHYSMGGSFNNTGSIFSSKII